MHAGKYNCAQIENFFDFRRKAGDATKRILINIQNTLFYTASSETIRRSGNELDPYPVDSPDTVGDDCKWIAPYALLMEVTSYIPWMLCERMKIRDAVKAQNPEYKTVLIVDENAEKEAARQVKKAKFCQGCGSKL